MHQISQIVSDGIKVIAEVMWGAEDIIFIDLLTIHNIHNKKNLTVLF